MHTLVTGPTGLIGRRLVLELLRQGHTVTLAMRRARARQADYDAWIQARGADPRHLTYVDFDLESPSLPDDLTPDAVFHLAAVFAWGLDPAYAERVHVDASVWLTQWSAALSTPPRLLWVGGYRAALPELSTEGAYEATKRRAHIAMHRLSDSLGLAWTAFHPATVFPDHETQELAQYDIGVHGMLQSLWRGELPVLPGGRTTFVPITRVDHLVHLMVGALTTHETHAQEYFVLDPETPALPALVDLAARHMGVRRPWFRLPVSLIAKLPQRLTGAHPEELAFLDARTYPTETTAALERTLGLTPPGAAEILAGVLDASVADGFGARSFEKTDG